MDPIYSLKLPPKSYRRTIEELSVTIPDPVVKLKFLKQAINEYQKISSQGNLKSSMAGIAFQKKLLDNAEELWPGSKKAAKNLIHTDVIATPDIKSRWVYKLRYIIGSAILMLFILGVGSAFSPLVHNLILGAPINRNSQQVKPTITKIIIRKPLIYSRPSNSQDRLPSAIVISANYQNGVDQVPKKLQSPILLALASQQTIISTPDRTTQKPVLSSRPSESENQSPSSSEKTAKYENEPEQDLKYFQNPILLALTSSQTKISTPDRTTQKPVLSSRPSESENQSPSSIDKSAKYENEPEQDLKYFQNPILLALASPQTKISTPDRTTQKPALSSRPSESENHSPSSIDKSAKYENKPEQDLKYFQNPILLALTYQKALNIKSDRITAPPLFSSLPRNNEKHSSSAIVKPEKHQIEPVQVPEYLEDPIWLVEKTIDREFYSNRLQIITKYTMSNIPREYYRFPKNSKYMPVNSKITDKISGIVFHASESDLYPFMPEMNRSILKYSKQLIKYLLRKKSYHFFIDRFGRVYRLVQEDHAAFHAGNSIWADNEEIFLNLNHAFIGICFEGRDFEEINITKAIAGQSTNSESTLLKPTGISSFNEAQLRSGKELTDWLRVKYKISQHNCVPHALTSVNPDKMLIGFHLDLSRGFPFTEFGLTDKYQEPLPSIVEFGFLYDDYFEKIFNGELWRGIRYSQDILQRQALNSGVSVAEYRQGLHRRFSRYREWNKKSLR